MSRKIKTNFSIIFPLAQKLDRICAMVGQSVSVLVLFMVLLQFSLVLLRYLFNFNWIALQESVLYMHATVFLLGAAYTYRKGGQVRVDIFYARLSVRHQALVNLCGILFLLLPMALFIGWISWPYVVDAWSVKEGSREAGGLPAVYILKTNILLMVILLVIQGLSDLARQYVIWSRPESRG